ncbi:hypothetical protein GCM10007421_20160 [Halopseudomonas oceani]|uniref:Translation initiation factor 2 n=1 Tax=Halopseudomonas oceani TaxID=1708783 RepID=A0A2P4EVE5_9GAMM|nr:hypothetical protein [Halopseudomonas oceani]POB03526.1 hypothetical protein C1949_09110 [Halopseudomonas oceani]GGE45938.1 hypothetical protein GCM10007421_20160 [Halopseudomonas oceani]
MLRPITLALLLCGLVGTASAQTADNTPSETPTETASQHDVGTLQAELAKVEAERQRLADQLAAGDGSDALTQLQDENQQLRNENQAARLEAQSRLMAQQQRWFMVGGLTVALSLLAGFMLAKIGRSKRREWLN